VKRRLGGKRRQRGAALILFLTVVVVGVAWYAVGALGKVPVATAEREAITGVALRNAKEALLSYVAQHAARSDTADPGQMPCPESLTLANPPGESAASCSATAVVVGRLPWRTLGVDPIRDGSGEPLWYVMRGFRDAPINFASAGQLTYNGSMVVALIIAPGVPISTSGTAPSGCTSQNQMVSTRNTATLVPANFLECGVGGTITSPGSAAWTNDRVIAITATEWADAISGAVADRLQRQVAPAMYDFYNTTSLSSWGTRFFPNSSIFNTPTGTDLCGDLNNFEGMPPVASVALGTCDTDWTGGSASGLGMILGFDGCTVFTTLMRCEFTVLLGGIVTPRISATAPRIGQSFRRVDTSQITYQICNAFGACGSQIAATTSGYSGSVSSGTGNGTFSFNVTLPTLSIANTVRVRIPHPTDALLADSRSAWYVNHDWGRYTYYGVARPASSQPLGTCTPGGTVTDCLTVNGMPSPNNDKRVVLLLGGRIMPGKTWTSTDPTNYFEMLSGASPTAVANNTTLADRNYTASTVTSTFNDRLAACPYRYYAADGTTVIGTACN
jgi:hypothetical protein